MCASEQLKLCYLLPTLMFKIYTLEIKARILASLWRKSMKELT